MPETHRDQVDAPHDEEPVTTGTVFLTLVLLMLIFGFWVMMYVTLLNR